MSGSGTQFEFYEFFAGGGMARLGLGAGWRCRFANEWCGKKARSYRENFDPADELLVEDIRKLTTRDLPGQPVLSWASFPCQDLSLAGNGKGLGGGRSGTFWAFWRLMSDMRSEGRAVPIVALENVVGAVTSGAGADFRAIVEAFVSEGYRVGALVVDARHFVPQSRPRLFIIGVADSVDLPEGLASDSPREPWHTRAIRSAVEALPAPARRGWVWWNPPPPPERKTTLASIVEEEPTGGVPWHSESETEHLISMMTDAHRERVREAARLAGWKPAPQKAGWKPAPQESETRLVVRASSLQSNDVRRVVGTLYRRTRRDAEGHRAQRAEVRFDGLSGCLRTPAGGSSRQTLIVVDVLLSGATRTRTRLLTPRETARLMGVGEEYRLPARYNEAYHLMGDAVAPGAVSWIERHIFRALARAAGAAGAAAR